MRTTTTNLAVWALLSTTFPAFAQSSLIASPNKEAQADALKLVRDLFETECAKSKPAEMVELANTLLRQSANTPKQR